MAAYLRAQHPDCRLVKAKTQKVAALRKYLRGPAKSDRIDALTLAKMPFIDPERLEEIHLPSTEILALQRLTRQRMRLEQEISGRKVRIEMILEGYVPGVYKAFSSTWSIQFRAFLRSCLNPFVVMRQGEESLQCFLGQRTYREKGILVESHQVFQACQSVSQILETSQPSGPINEEYFIELQDEISRELRLMEMEEAETEAVEKRISDIYLKLHSSDNLRTIPGVGEHTAPVFLASIGDPARFPNQAAIANYTGTVPGSRQSADMESKGLRMTKSGPSILRRALFQAGDIGRRYDPQLASVYYRAMVMHGKNHKQAMGAVMSHLGARIWRVLLDNRPYELRDIEGNLITRDEARKLILTHYQVPEDIRLERRKRKTKISKNKETAPGRIYEAAKAPQPV